MEKNIIFCADGTWNNPNQDHDGDEVADPTNVYKFFLCLDGMDSPAALLTANEQEKELASNGLTLQIAKYIHGVGDSRTDHALPGAEDDEKRGPKGAAMGQETDESGCHGRRGHFRVTGVRV